MAGEHLNDRGTWPDKLWPGDLDIPNGQPEFLMKFQESRKPISNWTKNEYVYKTLSLLQETQMPSNHLIAWSVGTWILFKHHSFLTSRASSNNEHISRSVTHFTHVVGPLFVSQRCNTLNEARSLHKVLWAVLQHSAPSLLLCLSSLVPMAGCTLFHDWGTWYHLNNGYLNMHFWLNVTYFKWSFKPLYLGEWRCQKSVKGWNTKYDRGTWAL